MMQNDEATIEEIELPEPNEPQLCPECGTQSVGEFCPHCGEKMEMHLFSVKHYIKEVFHEFAVFDSKFFRTIPALLFKPGFLSMEYMAGRRKRYLSPARLYTLIAFVSFFALGYYLRNVIEGEFQKQLASKGSFQIYAGNLNGEQARQLMETLLKLVIEVSPYVLLLGSTPIFALFLKIIYWKRRMLFAEHLVFSFHFYAFSLIVLIGSMLVPGSVAIVIASVLFLIYLYYALKRFYSDRGFSLVTRLVACLFAYFNIAGFAFVTTLALGYLIGYQLGELPGSTNSVIHLTSHP
jgi:hypothetical protein